MKITDVLSVSIRTIRSNGLRSGITIAIIALGITALVGIITAIGAMNQKLTESFSTIGANGFSIRAKERNFRIGNNRQMNVKRKGEKQEKKSSLGQAITLEEAERFAALFHYPSQLSIAGFAGNNNVVSASSKKTNPTVALFGSDEAYLDLNGFSVLAGRNFTRGEVQAGGNICVLGYDVALKLFGDNVGKAVNKEVRINNVLFRVVAVLNNKGSTFGFSRDNIVIITYKSLVRNFQYGTFTIGVKASQIARVEEAMGEAEGTFRNIRKLAVTEESNFALERNNSIAEKAITIIGLITLIGAAIGLMNIMLVAVAERTKEIGLIKAIGGKKATVHAQFLTEAMLISLAGAVIGIVLGITLGNLFALLLQTNFVIPWNWIVYGIVICSIVGLLAGLYPAMKAGKLNPIEALRYE